MCWSFSRLNSFYTCPYEWHKDYIECEEKAGSAQTQFGSFLHLILEKYAKDELSIFNVSEYYQENFDEAVTYNFPHNKYVDLRQRYYDEGLAYLDNINLNLEAYDVLGVEKKVKFEIDGYDVVGFIDLLLRDKETGEITILDHKSAKISVLKNGGIAKKDREHFESFKRQLYMYAKPVIEEYGRVDKLKWNLFRDQKFIEIPFVKKEYDKTLKWVVDTIKKIEAETDWNINREMAEAMVDGKFVPYYCLNLCAQRFACPFRNGHLQTLQEKDVTDE